MRRPMRAPCAGSDGARERTMTSPTPDKAIRVQSPGCRSEQPVEQPAQAAGFPHRRGLRSALVNAGVLCILLGGLVLAIPGLGAVAQRVAHAHWGWVVAGAALELASC